MRTEIGYDTQDFELDFVVSPDGSYAIGADVPWVRWACRCADGEWRSSEHSWATEAREDLIRPQERRID